MRGLHRLQIGGGQRIVTQSEKKRKSLTHLFFATDIAVIRTPTKSTQGEPSDLTALMGLYLAVEGLTQTS